MTALVLIACDGRSRRLSLEALTMKDKEQKGQYREDVRPGPGGELGRAEHEKILELAWMCVRKGIVRFGASRVSETEKREGSE